MPVLPPLPTEARETLASLSSVGPTFLDHARGTPELLSSVDWRHQELPEWIEFDASPMQPWPLFLGAEARDELERVAAGLTGLAMAIPERIFDADPERMGHHFPKVDPMTLSILLAPPTGLDSTLCRPDLIHTQDGFQCLELNVGAKLGGWTQRYWADWCLGRPALTAFLEGSGLEAMHRDTLRQFLRELVDSALAAGGPAEGSAEVHTIVLAPPTHPNLVRFADRLLGELYGKVLAEVDPDLGGELVVTADPSTLKVRRSRLYRDDRQVHVLVEHGEGGVLPAHYRCFKAGSILLYGGPLELLLGGKDILALLSEHADSELFDESERDLLRNHLPWTRLVTRDSASFRGETDNAAELMLRHREQLVLKPALGMKGDGVVIGPTTPQEQWSRALGDALADDEPWVAQECVRSRPYPYLAGDGEIALFDAIWGTFVVGGNYGGSFLRLQPRDDQPQVVNCAQGASEGLVFEV